MRADYLLYFLSEGYPQIVFQTESGRYELTDASNPESKGCNIDITSPSGKENVNCQIRDEILMSAVANTDWYFPGPSESFIERTMKMRNGSRDLIPEEWVRDLKKRKLLNDAAKGILELVESEITRQVSL